MTPALATLLLWLVAGVGHAGGINLSWNECGSEGISNRTFACNSNSLSNANLIASFVPTMESGFAASRELIFDFVSPWATLPDWWQVGPGGCRDGAMSLNADFSAGLLNCDDMWMGSPVAIASTYATTVAGRPDRARLVVSMQSEEGFALPPEYSEMEWYALRIALNGTRTVGSASCGDCALPMCVLFQSMRLDSANPSSSMTLANPLHRNWVTWQGGVVGVGCPAATPARNATWGRLKSLYR